MSDTPNNDPIDLSRVKTHSIHDRPALVRKDILARPTPPSASAADLIDSLPDVLAARALRDLIDAVAAAHRDGRPVALAMGAHVIKVGLGPLVIDMIDRGIITCIAMNGAGAIHDYELALTGTTSEDVADRLKDGTFGMVRETPQAYATAAGRAADRGTGLGRELGRVILDTDCPHSDVSVLAAAAKAGIPLTVHVAFGTDIVHMHPCIDPGKLGTATHIDFRILCSVVSELDGGVWMNVGSAVVLPEVFLKALAVARNIHGGPTDFTTADMDMIQHYRPRVNVVQRPGGKGITLTGQHEILLPLLRQGILARAGAID